MLETLTRMITPTDPRLSRRQEIHRQIAAARLDEQLAADIEQRIAALDDADETAVSKHQADCRPLQSEIGNLERQALDALENRQLVPQNVADRLAELRGKIDQHNSVLEATVSTNKKLRGQLQDDCRKAKLRAVACFTLENELSRHPLANPELLCQQFVTINSTEWNRKRLAAATASLARLQAAIDQLEESDRGASRDRGPSLGELVSVSRTHRPREGNAPQIAALRIQLDQWQAEADEARRLLAEADVRGRQLREQMIGE